MSAQKVPDADSHISPDAVSFLHVVIYAGIFLVIGLIAAFIIIKGVGKHIVPGKHDPHPTSQLILPVRQVLATQSSAELSFTIPQQKSKVCV